MSYETKRLIEELSKMPPMVVSTAYLHAINYMLYGEDVAEKWLTATQNASALSKAYEKGYYEGLKKQAERAEWVDDKCSACGKGIEDLIDSREWYRNDKPNFCPFCGLKLVDSQESEE